MVFKLIITIFSLEMIYSSHQYGPTKNDQDKTPNKLSIKLSAGNDNADKSKESNLYPNQTDPSCDVYCAYSTMYFHRSKMSEYLCHQYLAKEILDGLGGNRHHSVPIASRQTSLLNDEGSSGYTVWLNNFWDEGYDQNEGFTEEENYNKGNDDLLFQNQENEFEGGEITGFALPSPVEDQYNPSIVEEQDQYHPVFTAYPEAVPKQKKKKKSWPSPRGKGWYEEGLFEIGLSALAFLAFGAFVTNLIIQCVLYNQNATVVMMNMTTTGTGTGTGRAADSGQFVSEIIDADQLANMALISIDKLEEGSENIGRSKCLHYTLCNNNRINKLLDPSPKIWLPLWSFAMSWLSGRLKDNRLENLRASVLGLGGASCNLLYPDCK